MLDYKKALMLLIGVVLSSQIMAWPAAINWTEDNEGTGARKAISAAVDSATVNVPRCDVELALNQDNGSLTEDPYCHRYGLIWRPALNTETSQFEKQIDWDPELTVANDSDFRLPTIKELIRIVDYDFTDTSGDYDANEGGFTDTLIEYWLEKKCTDNGGDCSQQNVTLTGGSTQLKDGYLISSTYANIDGEDNQKSINGSDVGPFSQVFAIRISDGEVVLMEFGGKGPTFEGHPDNSSMLALCPGLLTLDDGSGSQEVLTGGCDYRVNGSDDGTKKQAADYSIVPVYALLVKEL